jgi:hypothetical protein
VNQNTLKNAGPNRWADKSNVLPTIGSCLGPHMSKTMADAVSCPFLSPAEMTRHRTKKPLKSQDFLQ